MARIVLLLLLVEADVLQQENLQKYEGRKRVTGRIGKSRQVLSITPPLVPSSHQHPSHSFPTWPFFRSLTLDSTSLPMESSALITVIPSSWDRRGAMGVSLNLSSGPLLGRPCKVEEREETSDECHGHSQCLATPRHQGARISARTLRPDHALVCSSPYPYPTLPHQVGGQQDPRPVLDEVLQGGYCGPDAGVIRDVLRAVQGNLQGRGGRAGG